MFHRLQLNFRTSRSEWVSPHCRLRADKSADVLKIIDLARKPTDQFIMFLPRGFVGTRNRSKFDPYSTTLVNFSFTSTRELETSISSRVAVVAVGIGVGIEPLSTV